MKRAVMQGLVALCTTCLSAAAFAQDDGWATRTVDDGQITVKYRVTTRVNEAGDELPLIEYVAATTAQVSLQAALALLKNPARHHEFTGDAKSERVAVLSDAEWVIHSHYASPWPFPDNDRVTRMTLAEDATGKTAAVTFVAAPKLYQETGVKRVTHYQAIYTLRDIGGGRVEIVLDLKMSPPAGAPLWILRAAFPGAGADIVRKLVGLAGKAS